MPILSRVGNDFRFGLKFAALKAMRKLKAGAKEIIIEDIPMRRHDLQQLTTRVIGTGVKLKTLRLQLLVCIKTSFTYSVHKCSYGCLHAAVRLSVVVVV